MRLFPEPLEIKPFDGFTKKDIFERKAFGEGLQRLFEQVEEPLTVILDSPWGTGKSTFIDMWCGHMRQHGFPIIHFDAFEHDYVDDAFTALVGEVYACAELYDLDNEAKKKFAQKAFDVTKKVLFAGAKGAVKTLVSKAVGKETVSELAEALSIDNELATKVLNEAFAKSSEIAMDEAFKGRIVARAQERKTLEAFRKELKKLATALKDPAKQLANDKGYEQPTNDLKRPLIFVIDELDRCKPTFSLAILETIKHLFAQDDIHFLLVAHMKQFESSVKHAYGIQGQEGEYLLKYYNLVVNFPKERIDTSELYYKELAREYIYSDENCNVRASLEVLLGEFSGISYRALERIDAQLRMILLNVNTEIRERFGFFITSYAFFKVLKPAVVAEFNSSTLAMYKFPELFNRVSDSLSNPEGRLERFYLEWGIMTGYTREFKKLGYENKHQVDLAKEQVLLALEFSDSFVPFPDLSPHLTKISI